MLIAQQLEYPSEIREIREAVGQFIEAEVKPRHKALSHLADDASTRYDSTGRYVQPIRDAIREIRMASAKAGFYAMCAPREIGGEGLGYLAWYGVWSKVAEQTAGPYWMGDSMIAHWASGPSPVVTQLSDSCRAEILPALLSGEKTMCFGMSEPDAGSDAMMMKTRATRVDGGWRIQGSKIWTSYSPYASYCILFAVTNPELAKARKGGISCFLVPTDSPGFEVQRIIKMWGQSGGNEAVLLFNDVFVPEQNLVGELDKGFSVAMLGVNLGRVYNSARAIATASKALREAFEYTRQRQTFGRPLSEYQGLTFPLTESVMDIQCAHLFALHTCHLLDQGHRLNSQLAIMKHQATRSAYVALDRTMQTFGAIGMTNEMHYSEMFLRLRMVNIADGSNEILKRTVSKSILSGEFEI